MVEALVLLACTHKGSPDSGAGGTSGSGGAGGSDVALFLHGGGEPDAATFTPFVAAAGNGHIVTIAVADPSAPETDPFDAYFTSLGAASAETVTLTSATDANADGLQAKISGADGVFLADGDRALFASILPGTAAQAGILGAALNGKVVGGTGAGAVALGQKFFDASQGDVAAADVVANPADPRLTFTYHLFDSLPDVLVEDDSNGQGRLPRLSVFVETWKAAGTNALGIGIDAQTAMLVHTDRTAEIKGRGAVTFVDATSSTATLTAPADIHHERLWVFPDGYVVDLKDVVAPVLGRPSYAQTPPAPGTLSGFPTLPVDGGVDDGRTLGDWQIGGLSDANALSDGKLTLSAGDGTVPGTVVVTNLYEQPGNGVGGLLWALGQHPGEVAIGLAAGNAVALSPPATITPSGWALVIDGRSVEKAGIPVGDEDIAALESATLDLTSTPWSAS